VSQLEHSFHQRAGPRAGSSDSESAFIMIIGKPVIKRAFPFTACSSMAQTAAAAGRRVKQYGQGPGGRRSARQSAVGRRGGGGEEPSGHGATSVRRGQSGERRRTLSRQSRGPGKTDHTQAGGAEHARGKHVISTCYITCYHVILA
jgi:hypothetical protein